MQTAQAFMPSFVRLLRYLYVLFDMCVIPQGNTANNTRVYAVKALGNVAKYNDARVVKALLRCVNETGGLFCTSFFYVFFVRLCSYIGL